MNNLTEYDELTWIAGAALLVMVLVAIRYGPLKEILSTLVARAVSAGIFFVVGGLFWLNTGGDLTEHLYKYLLCPVAPLSQKCSSSPAKAEIPDRPSRILQERPSTSSSRPTQAIQKRTDNDMNAIIRGQ